MAAPSGIHGKALEIRVLACYKLKDTEWFSKQDPYVRIDYATTKHRTRTCTDGGKNPTFSDKFTITLVEGLHEIFVGVWNSNTLTRDDFIGRGRVLLNNVLRYGFEDVTVPIEDTNGRYAGEVKLIMNFQHALVQNASRRNEALPPQYYLVGAYVPGGPPIYAPQYPYAPPNTYAQPPPLHPTYYESPACSCPYCCPSDSGPQTYPPPQYAYRPQGYAPAAAATPIYPPVAAPTYPPAPSIYPPSAPSAIPPYRTDAGQWSYMNP